MSLEVLDESSSSYNFAGLSAQEIKKLLTKSIQLNMRQLRATDVLASKHIMLIARSLMKLLETFGHGHKGRFLDYANNRHGISKSSYYYYMEYYAFMLKYPKFQNLAVSFRVFRSMILKLTQWFISEECQALDDSDFYSIKIHLLQGEKLISNKNSFSQGWLGSANTIAATNIPFSQSVL
jgi:hypothetical protein